MLKLYEVLVCYSTNRYTTHTSHEVMAECEEDAIQYAWEEFSELEIDNVQDIDYIVNEIDEVE